MLGVSNYVSSLKKTFSNRHSSLSSSGSKHPSFHLFPLLPAELRRKIWQHALPERIIEASLARSTVEWFCIETRPARRLDARKISVLFAVCVESRELCLEQYVRFANTYIHSTLDTLFLSWYQDARRHQMQPARKYITIEGKPLERLQNVVITAAKNTQFEKRFGALIECFQRFGSPKEITLGLDGPKLPQFFSDTRGFSISTGHQVIALTWLRDTVEKTSEQVQPDQVKPKSLPEEVEDAFRIEKEEGTCDFKFPKVKERMLYIYSGP
ncbi:hypothetical protein EG329_006875 [Mollisiaceae sp. DMI_Dod_QoI]|nr:hypothetical protein EG329_006875 [Helotiales sp. DMI_Dod_QoI]